MARYEIQKWITGYAIRDTEDETYVRDYTGDVSVYSLGDLSDMVPRMNKLDADDKAQRAAYIAWNGTDEGYDPAESYDDDGYQDDDLPGYEEDHQSVRYGQGGWLDYCDAMGYDPMEYVNAEDYAAQNR